MVQGRCNGQVKLWHVFVDEVSFKGPPDSVSIKALSVPFTKGGKDTKKTKAWENTTLQNILTDVAKEAGLKLVYDAPTFLYDRVEQDKKHHLRLQSL